MTDLAAGPLTKRAYELCRQVDGLPYAGLELTATITAMSEFIQMCETHEKAATRALVKYKQWEDDSLQIIKSRDVVIDGLNEELRLYRLRLAAKDAELEAARKGVTLRVGA